MFGLILWLEHCLLVGGFGKHMDTPSTWETVDLNVLKLRWTHGLFSNHVFLPFLCLLSVVHCGRGQAVA